MWTRYLFKHLFLSEYIILLFIAIINDIGPIQFEKKKKEKEKPKNNNYFIYAIKQDEVEMIENM